MRVSKDHHLRLGNGSSVLFTLSGLLSCRPQLHHQRYSPPLVARLCLSPLLVALLSSPDFREDGARHAWGSLIGLGRCIAESPKAPRQSPNHHLTFPILSILVVTCTV